jgi:hypothetical protein
VRTVLAADDGEAGESGVAAVEAAGGWRANFKSPHHPDAGFYLIP